MIYYIISKYILYIYKNVNYLFYICTEYKNKFVPYKKVRKLDFSNILITNN